MAHTHKTRLKQPWCYIKLTLVIIIAIVIAFCALRSFHFAVFCSHAIQNPLQLDAQIVSVREHTGDELASYDAIMRYEYQDITYETVYQSFTNREDAYDLMGKTVTAVVDMAHPSETIASYQSSAITLMMTAVVFVLLFLLTCCFPHRKSNVATYGWRMETVKKDILLQQPYPMAFLMACLPCCAVYAFSWPQIFSAAWELIGFMLVNGILFLVGAGFLIRYLLDRRLMRDDQILLRQDICVKKRTQKDSDGEKEYVLTFSNGKREYKRRVNKSFFAQISEGTAVDAAYLGSRKKPALCYSVLTDDVF